MKDQEKIQQGADELIQFINKVMSGIKKPLFSSPHRTVNHTHITVVIQPPHKGWIRRQLAKLF